MCGGCRAEFYLVLCAELYLCLDSYKDVELYDRVYVGVCGCNVICV